MHTPVAEPKRYSPFWICLVVFIALAVDNGARFSTLNAQRAQLDEAEAGRAKNALRLKQLIEQREQIEPRLQALSMDLLQIAQTNGAARQIVQEFNIQFAPPPAGTPRPVPSAPLTPPAKAK